MASVGRHSPTSQSGRFTLSGSSAATRPRCSTWVVAKAPTRSCSASVAGPSRRSIAPKSPYAYVWRTSPQIHSTHAPAGSEASRATRSSTRSRSMPRHAAIASEHRWIDTARPSAWFTPVRVLRVVGVARRLARKTGPGGLEKAWRPSHVNTSSSAKVTCVCPWPTGRGSRRREWRSSPGGQPSARSANRRAPTAPDPITRSDRAITHPF